jgi:hypothetical protein
MSMRLWCLVIDHEQKLVGSCFTVNLPLDACAHGLRKKVKEVKPNDLAGVDPDRLMVWKMTRRIRLEELEEEEALDQYIKDLRLKNEKDEPADDAHTA